MGVLFRKIGESPISHSLVDRGVHNCQRLFNEWKMMYGLEKHKIVFNSCSIRRIQ
jgi:hypothetical protein